MTEYLKCDAEGCDHVEVVGVIEESMIGMQCAKCSASLLTSEDYAFFVAHMKPLSDALHALGLTVPASFGEAGAVGIGNHNGSLTITLPQPSTPEDPQP